MDARSLASRLVVNAIKHTRVTDSLLFTPQNLLPDLPIEDIRSYKASSTIPVSTVVPRSQGLVKGIYATALMIMLLFNASITAFAVCELPDGDIDGDECLSQDTPKNYGGCGADSTGAPVSCGDPINIAIGNKYETEFDYVSKGPSPLVLSRSYNSLDTNTSNLGVGWRVSYSRSISVATGYIIINGYYWYGTYATATRDDGKVLTFSLQSGTWVSEKDVNAKLASISSGGYTYTSGRDEVETYSAAGHLTSIQNRAGLQQNLSYDASGHLVSISDSFGRSLNFAYTGALLTLVTVPDGNVYQYGYDAKSNLIKVTYPDQTARSFLYENLSYPHALTGVVDENGSRYSTDAYDSTGRDISTQIAGGVNKFSLNFNYLTNSYVPVTDALNVTRTSYFTIINNVPAETSLTQSCPTCAAANVTAQRVSTYDANGNVTRRTDFNGNATCYAYDTTRNLQTVRIEGVPAGVACPANLAAATLSGTERKITTQWHANFRLPVVVAEPTRITTYSYDSKGNLLTLSIQPTADVSGGAGLSAALAGTARTTSYTYNAAGQVLTVDGPRIDVADITQYAYDAQSNLVTVTNPLNQTTTIGNYDANGRPHSITGPNGLSIAFVYDARGRVTSRDAAGEVTHYSYDAAGNLINISLPSGAIYSYTYDAAHRLIQIADGENNKLVYTLDNVGNHIKEELFDYAGNLTQTRSRVFDALSQLVQDIGAVNQTIGYTYDKNGNRLTVIDPLNRLTTNVYDALNRLNRVISPDTGVVQYIYDGHDLLASVTDPRNLVTQYTRDGLGELTQQTSPDTGVTSSTYDEGGNILGRTDAKGQVATIAYDALNRITSVSYAGAPTLNVTYLYDQGTNGIGHLTGVTDATGTVSYAYDLHGRLTDETAQRYGSTYHTGYSYDTQGRLATITYPSGRSVNYSFDTLGRINGISTTSRNGLTKVVASAVTYQPFGEIKSFTHGDGQTAPVQTYTRQQDQDGRIAGYSLNGHGMAIGYDAASQISFITDPQNLAATANYNYDPMSRLSGFVQGTSSQSFGYDLNGNRVSQTIGSTSTNNAYATDSNWLTSLQTGVTTQAVSHDLNGSTIADANQQYTYDARGRLIQTATAQGVVNYEINALGLRVRKEVPYAQTDTEYHYDVAGHLIAESPVGSTRFSREYIWLGNLPVAVMK